MRSRLLTSPAIAVALLLAAGTATASAQTSQSVGQAALNGQLAQSLAGSTQSDASNVAVPVSILSPGSNGSVSQSNNSNANSDATNNNGTTQTADQSQAGGGAGLGAIQAAGQAALNGQTAVSGAESSQQSPTNVAVPIRILSPGSNGSVDQSNNSNANSDATNNNGTTQTADQSQASGGAGLGAVQSVGQLSRSAQGAGSVARSNQVAPTNRAVSIRILSPGSNGSVSQSNNSNANSDATNNNGTTQTADQSQAGGGAGLGAIQAAGQAALNGQTAVSGAESSQQSPTNVAVPIRILSPGSNGSVDQSNNSNANSDATNNNDTTQTISQDPKRLLERFDASPIQAAGQLAGNRQEALSEAISRQFDPTNLDLPVRIFSPGENGSVSQSNNSNANSDSTNNNDTTQSVMQALDEGLLRF